MDSAGKSCEEIKIQKKLINAAKKIQRNRKNLKKIEKETKAYQEIRQLLNVSENETGASGSNGSSPVVNESGAETSSTIPLSAPGLQLLQDDKVFSLFDKDVLSLKEFCKSSSITTDCKFPNEDLLQKLIAHNASEIIVASYGGDDDKLRHSVGLHMLYLLSVHSDPCFVFDCLSYLKSHDFEVKPSEVLPIFVNFGAVPEELIEPGVIIDCPVSVSNHGQKRCVESFRFPFYNLEMIANYLLHRFTLTINKEPEWRLLAIALTRLNLDIKIRSSRLFPLFSQLLSLISQRLTEVFEAREVAGWLHLNDEHILNRVEIARVVLMPLHSGLHYTLIVKTVNFILQSDAMKLSESINGNDLLVVLNKLENKKLTPLEIYCALQLINASLPSITATNLEADNVNKHLVSLESRLSNVTDQIDLVRIKLEIAKFRNFVVNAIGMDGVDSGMKGKKQYTCSI